jgi:hypothetical protein
MDPPRSISFRQGLALAAAIWIWRKALLAD